MRRALVASVLASVAACAPQPAAPPPVAAPLTAPEPQVASTTSASVDQPPPPRDDGRLPVTATPRHYAVTLDVDPTQERFKGQVTIDIDLAAPTSSIVLHGRDLNLTDITATMGSVAVGGTATSRLSHGGVMPEEIVLAFPQALPAGHGTLSITYDAPFGKELSGLYRVKEGERWYAFTQFESTAARRAFPCFDEPGSKVPFDLEITAPKGMIAVANTPEASRVDTSPTRTRFDFAPTPPLPTYLLAFAVGDFDVREGAKDPVPIRLITVKGKAQLGETALDMTAGLVKKLGEYFAISYPFPKLDVVAVPDFAAGAMENPGLITFREELLLMDPAHSSARARHSAAATIAHELSHIWFGDLVTMQWWNDVWLNEGFADWMDAKAVDAWHPEYAEHLYTVDAALAVMDIDALASARAVRQPVASTGEIEEAFDGISYEKGAAVLEMIEHWVGPETFQRGVRDYLHAHAWKNARSEDLWSALDHASGRDVTGMATSFIERPGVPNVTVKSSCVGGKPTLDLTQAAWHPLGVAAKPTDDTPWHIPVCVHALSAPRDECTDLTTAHASLELKSSTCGATVFPNAGVAGYYRYSLSDADVRALARDQTHLDVASRMGLVSNLWAQVRAGELGADVLLDVLPAFDKETDRHVVRDVIDTLYAIDHALVDDATRPAFRAYVAARLAPQKRRLGWQAKPGEDDDLSLLRSDVLMGLGDLAREASTIQEAEALAVRWLKNPGSVDANVASTAIYLGSLRSGPARLDELRAAAKRATTPSERISALSAMSAFDDKAMLARAFDLILTDEVKMQDMRYVFGGLGSGWSVFGRTDKARALFSWLQTHWDGMRAKVPDGFGSYYLVSEVAAACSVEERDAEATFLQKHVSELEGATRPLAESLESATSCSALRVQGGDAVAKYFARGKTGTKGR